jgi:hypothetical protein
MRESGPEMKETWIIATTREEAGHAVAPVRSIRIGEDTVLYITGRSCIDGWRSP